MSVTWSGGLNFDGIEAALAKGADRGVEKAGEHILDASKREAPTESGTLRDSGKVTWERQGSTSVAAVAYTAVHAVRTHEDLDDHHDDGHAKFLERPLHEEAPAAARIIAETIRAELQ